MLGDTFPLNQYPSITLTPPQIESGRFQAAQRDADSRRFGWQDSRGLTSNQSQYSLLGSLAEVAAHVYLKLPFSYSINKPHEADLITNAGTSFDVKCAQGVHLVYVPQEHCQRGHNFIFAHSPDSETFYFLGYLANSEVGKYTLQNPGGRLNRDGSPALCYVIPTYDLHPVPQGRTLTTLN